MMKRMTTTWLVMEETVMFRMINNYNDNNEEGGYN